jgi:poly-gamma-glutamate synthesis protein (capsule biosynthesis protein)
MYFATLDAGSGRLAQLALTPMRIRRFRLERAAADDARWLQDSLSREGRRFGTRVEQRSDNRLLAHWN